MLDERKDIFNRNNDLIHQLSRKAGGAPRETVFQDIVPTKNTPVN